MKAAMFPDSPYTGARGPQLLVPTRAQTGYPVLKDLPRLVMHQVQEPLFLSIVIMEKVLNSEPNTPTGFWQFTRMVLRVKPQMRYLHRLFQEFLL